MENVSGVLPEWRIGGTAFTSGIANRANPLAYHKDGANFPDSWNAMIILSHRTKGGLTVVPEYRFAISPQAPVLTLMNSSELWHGVTPINKAKGGYRYSAVYYAMHHLCNCGTRDEELSRLRLLKTERERKRAEA